MDEMGPDGIFDDDPMSSFSIDRDEFQAAFDNAKKAASCNPEKAIVQAMQLLKRMELVTE